MTMKKSAFRYLKDISFNTKIRLVIIGTSLVTLLLVSIAFVLYELSAFRNSTVAKLATVAEIIGTGVTPAVFFRDKIYADEILRILDVEKHIVSTYILTDGSLFSAYHRDPAYRDRPLPLLQEEGYRFDDEYLYYFHPISFDNEALGTLCIKYDLLEIQSRQNQYLMVLLGILVTSFIAAFLLSTRFQKIITQPILNLAHVAGLVSSEKDYSIRAKKHDSHDEVGILVDSFNNMLGQIEQQDRNLKDTKDFSDNIIDSSLDCIMISNRKGYLTRVNKYFLDLLGYTEEEVLGRHISEFAPPEVRSYKSVAGDTVEIKQEFYDNQFAMMAMLKEQGKVSGWDAYYYRKDGKVIPIEQNIVYLYGKRGERTGSVGISRDVTQRRKAERELKETGAFLDNIIESSLDSIFVTDMIGNITRCNKSFQRMLGYEEKEMVGQHIVNFAPPEEGMYPSVTGDEVEINDEYYRGQIEMLSTFVETGVLFNWDSYYCRKDKKLVPVGQTGYYLHNDEGVRIGSVCMVRDISEIKRSERDLKETQAFLDNIIESSQDCILVSDTKGNLVRANKFFLNLLGYKQEEIIGKHISEFTPLQEGVYASSIGTLVTIDKEYLDQSYSMVSALVETGKVTNRETYFLTKDKNAIPIEESIVLLYDDVGKRIGAVGILRDITARKKAENEIVDARDFLENIFRTSVDGIMATDRKGNITMVNTAVEEILGYSKDELVGKNATELDLRRSDYNKRGKEFFTTVMEKGFIKEFEYIWMKKDRTEVDVELNAATLKDRKGEFSGVVSGVRDITERKRTEKMLKEYQNQLRSLASQLTLTEERARRRIATDLHDRIGQALAMTKIHLGSLRKSLSSSDLGEDVDKIRNLIEQTIQDTRSLIFDLCPPFLYELGFEKALEWLLENIEEQHGIHTLFQDNGISKPLDDDMRILLYQTVRELLMNVVKHAHAKKVRVSSEGDGGHIKIRVEDDGIGFDTSKIDARLGIPYGFGLFRIMERLHYLDGEVRFESKPNVGTKVSVVVPIKQSG